MGDFYLKENCLLEMTPQLCGPILRTATLRNEILQSYGSFEALDIKARERGNWHAKYLLSLAYKDGVPDMNVEKDLDNELRWLESSIDDGNVEPNAAYDLGTLYDIKGTVPCRNKAHELFHKAAKCGVREAELSLAKSYLAGVDGVVNRDVEEAFKWCRRAAGEELTENVEYVRTAQTLSVYYVMVEALVLLYDNYMTGDCPEGKPQPLKAIHYLKKAAEAGHTKSQTKLGQTYLTGVPGVPKDLEKAKTWFEKAAKNGSTKARKVLEKFDHQGAFEAIQVATEPDEKHFDNTFQQVKQFLIDNQDEIKKGMTQHPYLVDDPQPMLKESMFTQFPESPTARKYLKAFRLAEEGFAKLQDNFNEAVKLLACSYLYENTVIQYFPLFHTPGFRKKVLPGIFEEFKVNGKFFEGLVLLFLLYKVPVYKPTVSNESCRIDLKKTEFLKNVIHLIENNSTNESTRTERGDTDLEESYACWLHVLYYFLGSHYIISGLYDEGAQAFEKALQCCPSYYEAKAGFAFCLKEIYLSPNIHQNNSNCKGKEKTEQEAYRDAQKQVERTDEKSYLRWKRTDLRKKAEQLFVEYLHEAPVCDKKYPDCHYHLACLFLEEKNIQKAREWKAKGKDAEKKRLPFMKPVEKLSFLGLSFLDFLPVDKDIPRCSNTECSAGTTVKNLRSCPCKQVSYCGRDCQAEDWKKGHKITCSARTKTKPTKKNP